MAKNIVICCDGTGNRYGRDNTNVVHLYELLVRDDRQAAYYDPGVGTFSLLGHTAGRRVGILLGKAFGAGLRENIEDAYEYLMNRFEPDDKVFLFGFSRGAFQVRCLAGMLNKCGLLEKGSRNLVPYATEIYMAADNAEIAAGFKNAYSHECKPHLVGVWDTVASLGWFLGKKFHDQNLNHDVKYGYQAIAVDEKRAKFPVSIWNESYCAPQQTIEQVWFPGVHSDVGGSYPDRGLSDGALLWMAEKAQAQGMLLRDDWRSRLNPNALGVLHESRQGLWRLWRPVERRIPEGATIHGNVIERMTYEPTYRPRLPRSYDVVPSISDEQHAIPA